jgi:hypothetical protein
MMSDGRQGWYPDEQRPGMLRYWDGSQWTEHRVPDPARPEATVPLPPPAPPPPTSGTPRVGQSATSIGWGKAALIAIVAFALGIGAGAAGSGDGEADSAAQPVQAVTTKTVTADVGSRDRDTSPNGDEETPVDDQPTRAEVPDGSFVMPDETGANLQVAQDDLQEAANDPFYFSDSRDATDANRFQVLDSGWQVCSQEPDAGSTVGPKDLVTFYVVRLSEQCP